MNQKPKMGRRLPTKAEAILKQGVNYWNTWRESNPDTIPSLDDIDLIGADLRGIQLFDTNIRWADLSGANLSGANLYQSEFYKSRLNNCELIGADVRGAKFHDADLSGSILSEANLYRCDFINTQLSGATFSGAYCGTTAFSNVDLSDVNGLDQIRHMGPSNVDLLTVSRSRHALPYAFLQAAGVPESIMDTLLGLSRSKDKQSYYSCFISYSHKDEPFAEKLYVTLKEKGVPVWYAPEDVRAGLKLYDQIRDAIHAHDKLIIVLSAHSMTSQWVITELRSARRRESEEKRQILFPISLASIEELKRWECFDVDSGKDLAVEIREYFIPDFSQWQDYPTFARQIDKILKDIQFH
jgi:hypothetical protein